MFEITATMLNTGISHWAENGAKALGVSQLCSGSIDMIPVDVYMPVKNGLEIAEIRNLIIRMHIRWQSSRLQQVTTKRMKPMHFVAESMSISKNPLIIIICST